jgi:exopolysaccharide biosynthesis polyprenyl glycosylphosphotransferase
MDRSLNPVFKPSPTITMMVKHSLRRYRSGGWLAHILLLLFDQVLVLLGFSLAYLMRYHVEWHPLLNPIVTEVATQNFVGFTAFLPITLLLIVVLTILFETKGLYRLPRGTGILDYSGIIVSSVLTGIALLIVVVFLYRPFYYSRLIFAFAGFTIMTLLIISRGVLLLFWRWAWAHGYGTERVLVVGGNGLGHQVMDAIIARPSLGYHLVGYLHDKPPEQDEQHTTPHTPYPHLGTIDQMKQYVQQHAVHQVILALPFWEHGRLPQLVQVCRALGVEFQIAPDLYELSFDRVDVLNISGVPLIGLKDNSIKGWNLAVKRTLDVALILLALPFLLPFMALIALVIRLDSPGPALFRQTRVGKHGKLFTCYKFRTMVVDAEQRKAELAALNEADGPLFKIRSDPRITRVGRFLRQSSLDELPQLINVLRGEMSLVGPRPGLPEEVEQYDTWHCRRLEVTPGLTGLWQVLGRSDTTFDEMVRLDIYYTENWSVGMDVHILLKTIPVVLVGKGAY